MNISITQWGSSMQGPLRCEGPSGVVEKMGERGRGEGGEMQPIYISVLCFAGEV
jgi:hypothetical protein